MEHGFTGVGVKVTAMDNRMGLLLLVCSQGVGVLILADSVCSDNGETAVVCRAKKLETSSAQGITARGKQDATSYVQRVKKFYQVFYVRIILVQYLQRKINRLDHE